MRPSNFTIALLLGMMFAGLFGLWMGTLTNEYGVGDFNSTHIDNLQDLSGMQDEINESREAAMEIKDTTGGLDLVGITSKAIQSIKIVVASFGVFTGMLSASLDAMPVGGAANIVKSYIGTIVLVALIVGGLVSAVVKWRT